MKKLIVGLLFLFSTAVFAEPSFDQIQQLIEQRQYSAAESGLELIIKNHPQSAKAFYAMAQTQAGLGNLEKARYALNKARGLNPSLEFASSSNVENLEQAITPQTEKITYVSESHFWRNTFILIFMFGSLYAFLSFIKRKREQENKDFNDPYIDDTDPSPKPSPTPSSSYSDSRNTVNNSQLDSRLSRYSKYSKSSPSRSYSPSAPSPSHTTVINNNHGSDNGLLTGVLLGEMLSNNHNDHTTVIERETVIKDPSWDDTDSSSSSRDSSWDDTGSNNGSIDSSWDDTDSSSKSRDSSWDSDSSNSSSSSWDSGSSSSSSSWDSGSSSSSSSWDSGSSSSSDSSSSSSSWD